MKKSAKKSTASVKAGVKKTAIKDLAAGPRSAGVKGGRKTPSQPTYGCNN